MKMIAKTISIVLILAIALMFSACGSDPTPSDAVKADLDKMKSEDSSDQSLKALDLEEWDLKKDDVNTFLSKIRDFDYEIVEEKVEEDKATVEVKITTYNFGKAMGEIFAEALALAFSNPDASEEEVSKIFVEKMAGIEKKDYSKKVTVNCVKKDDKWTTDVDSNEKLEDAVLGGLNSKIEEMNNMWDE